MLNSTAEFVIDENTPVCVIAEAGVNHDGSLDIARQLIDAAADAGADYVKFQTFKTEKLVTPSAPMAGYQIRNTGVSESQFDMLKRLELDKEAHMELIDHCKKRNIKFLSTPFDIESARLLGNEIRLPLLKIPSGELTNGPLLLEVAKMNLPVIVSTGMATLNEVEQALAVLAFGYTQGEQVPSIAAFTTAFRSPRGQEALKKKVILLHCTSQYPAPFEDLNLRAMLTLRETFSLPVGYSDHSLGISIPSAAVAMGARLIEKHFTIDKNRPGPDHKASLEPGELKAMIRNIREIEKALGSSIKAPTKSDLENIAVARKSVVAIQDIKSGQNFSSDNIDVMRPGTGTSPLQYWALLSRRASRDYKKGEVVKE
jgi:N-acetylneuraminate synthase